MIERAKGAVMKRLGVDEEGAFRRLKRAASNENKKVVEAARAVLEADAVFQELERLEKDRPSDNRSNPYP